MALFERAYIKAVRADLLKRTLVCNVEIDLNDDTLAEAQRVRIMADSGEAVMVQIVPNDDQGRLWREDTPEQFPDPEYVIEDTDA